MYSKAAICLGLQVALIHVGDAKSLHKSSGSPRVGACVSNDQCPSSYFCHSEYRCCPCASCSEPSRIAGDECAKDERGCESCSGSLDPSLEENSVLGQDGGSSGVGICLESDQCASGYFCHSDYKCHPCFDCSGANRAPGEGCAPDASRCGSYLDRYEVNNTDISNGTNNTTNHGTKTWIVGENSESNNYSNIMKTPNESDVYTQPTYRMYTDTAYYILGTVAIVLILIPIIWVLKKPRFASTMSQVSNKVTTVQGVADNNTELVPLRNTNGTANNINGTADNATQSEKTANGVAGNEKGPAGNASREILIERRHSISLMNIEKM